MDKDSIDGIRSATFPVARRGYDQREVDRYLNRLADWLETGAGDQTRSDLVRRELGRIGEKTGQVLIAASEAAERIEADAGKAAQEIRAAAEREAGEELDAAKRKSKALLEAVARRKRDMEKVISDLEARRDAALAELERLATEVGAAASQHRDGTADGERATAKAPANSAPRLSS